MLPWFPNKILFGGTKAKNYNEPVRTFLGRAVLLLVAGLAPLLLDEPLLLDDIYAPF